MRKIYLFICTLMCAMGATYAYAQGSSEETIDLSLELDAETALKKDCGRGAQNISDRLPSAEGIKLYFTGDNRFITTTMSSTSGMSWGVHQSAGDPDLRNRSTTGFSFYGRGGYSGEYVAQMYAPVYEVKSLDVSFKATENVGSMTFSIWKIATDGTATMLASKSSWTVGENNTFSVPTPENATALTVYGDRLLLIWNSWTKGQSVTISDYVATIHCTPNTAHEVTFKAQKQGTSEGSFDFQRTLRLPIGQIINTADFLPTTDNSWIKFEAKEVEVTSTTSEVFVTYEDKAEFPYATSYQELIDKNKWFSMFTLNGRMYVYDDESMGNTYQFNNETGEFVKGEDGFPKITGTTKRYPCIDRATFTRLNDNFFWGFVCENPFFSTSFKIVNKGAGPDETLYLTRNIGNDPLLLYTEEEAKATSAKVTNEWVVEKSSKSTIAQWDPTSTYFGVKANGTNKYINNHGGSGYMTTHTTGANGDDGSNIKFTLERATYDIMKERALNAPCEAVHSLDQASRNAIKEVEKAITEEMTDAEVVAKYQEVIENINTANNGTGFIEFDEKGYYFLRNYTPAGEGMKVFALGSDGTNRSTVEIPAADAGSESVVMKSSNVNLIWKITTATEGAPGTGIGASKTIGRKVTNVNSNKQLGAINSVALVEKGSGTNYYFVELGAGQHFLKTAQYIGNGQQASANPLRCGDNGNLNNNNGRHVKNSRDTWYGIRVKSIEVEISDAGWATLHLPFGVEVPAGLEAYVVSDIDGTTAMLTNVNVIPANQGVILKGDKGPYTLTINDAVAWDDVTNHLEGSNIHENIAADAYVLSSQNGVVGLYKAEKNQEGNTKWLNNDNKAYLPAGESNAPSLSFVFDGVETSIKNVETTKGEGVIYDLSGRRVKSAQKGIFIINGKKVIK